MPPAPPAPSEMNGLVYQYLVAAGLSSTAKKFKKEAAFSGTADDCDHSLVDIFHFYRTHRAQLDSADADSPAKKRRKLANGESAKVNDVIKEEQKEVAKPQVDGVDADANATTKKSKKNKTKKKNKSKKESAATKKKEPVESTATKKKEPVEPQATEKKAKKSKKSKKKKDKKEAAKEVAEAPVAESESQNDDKESTNLTPATDTPVETGAEGGAAESSNADEQSQKRGKKRRRSAPAPNAPFQRVKPLEVVQPWQDNSYNPVSSYGAKAFSDLIVTRGKGFRHEKTKKKRGSYRGGTISMASNSYKF